MTLAPAVSKKLFNHRWLAAVSAVILTIGLGLAVSWAKQKDLFHLSSDRPFTELYFSNPTAVPTTLSPGQHYKIPFVITNRSESVKKYTFRVIILSHNQSRSFPEHTITLQSQERAFRQAVFTAESKGPIELSVVLLNENQAITLKMGQ